MEGIDPQYGSDDAVTDAQRQQIINAILLANPMADISTIKITRGETGIQVEGLDDASAKTALDQDNE
jgi:hypothetical protein